MSSNNHGLHNREMSRSEIRDRDMTNRNFAREESQFMLPPPAHNSGIGRINGNFVLVQSNQFPYQQTALLPTFVNRQLPQMINGQLPQIQMINGEPCQVQMINGVIVISKISGHVVVNLGNGQFRQI